MYERPISTVAENCLPDFVLDNGNKDTDALRCASSASVSGASDVEVVGTLPLRPNILNKPKWPCFFSGSFCCKCTGRVKSSDCRRILSRKRSFEGTSFRTPSKSPSRLVSMTLAFGKPSYVALQFLCSNALMSDLGGCLSAVTASCLSRPPRCRSTALRIRR